MMFEEELASILQQAGTLVIIIMFILVLLYIGELWYNLRQVDRRR